MWLGRGGLREGQLVPEADAESRRESAPIVPEGRAPGFKRELIPRVHRRAWSPIRDGTGQKGRCWGASPPSRKGESRRRKNMGLGVLTAGTGWGAEAIVVGAALGTLGSSPRTHRRRGERAGVGPGEVCRLGFSSTALEEPLLSDPLQSTRRRRSQVLDTPQFVFLVDGASNGRSAVAAPGPDRPTLRSCALRGESGVRKRSSASACPGRRTGDQDGRGRVTEPLQRWRPARAALLW